MRESEDRVDRAVQSLDPGERMVAGRILGIPHLQRAWTAEHSALLQGVADERRPSDQVAALKVTSFKLIHRKALFEYLRSRPVTRQERKRVLTFFHPTRGATDAFIAEHHEYLRSACSYLCTSYLGRVVIGDGTFEDPFATYEDLHTEYFRAFCDVALGSAEEGEVDSVRALLPYLKHRLTELRLAILALPHSKPRLLEEAYLRRPTNDTVKLRRPAFDPKA